MSLEPRIKESQQLKIWMLKMSELKKKIIHQIYIEVNAIAVIAIEPVYYHLLWFP